MQSLTNLINHTKIYFLVFQRFSCGTYEKQPTSRYLKAKVLQVTQKVETVLV